MKKLFLQLSKKTKLIKAIGQVLEQSRNKKIKKGVNVFLLNFNHMNHETHIKIYNFKNLESMLLKFNVHH